MHRNVLDQPTYARIARFAQLTERSINDVMILAVNDWMDTTGETILDCLAEKKAAAAAARPTRKRTKRSFSAPKPITHINSHSKFRPAVSLSAAAAV